MSKSKLDPKIYALLTKKTKNRIKEGSIKPIISGIRRKYPQLTLNAAAEVFAKQRGFSVARYLTTEDRKTMSNMYIVKVEVPRDKIKNREKLDIIAKYDTDDKLLNSNILEINKTYTNKCYTACFVLCRKVLENLLIYKIIRKKYPNQSDVHRKKYYDFDRARFLEFSKIIKNLRESSHDFGPEKSLVERICQLAEGFKETANEMTHSLYHVAKKKDIDDKNFQETLDLIKMLEN